MACYQTFIRGLLDLTDNIDGGEVVPAGTSCATTATTRTWSSPPTRAPRRSRTSPTASRIEEGFWLGDAFASGGSTGYDHKKMGITARGAWESVEAPLPRARARHPVGGLHGRRHRRHVRRRVRQRHAAVAPHPAGRRVQPPARLHRPGPGPRAQLRGAAAAVRAARLDLGRLRPRRDLGGRRRVRARGEVDPALAGGARGARDRGRVAEAERADPGAAPRARRPALERRHRHLREGAAPRATPTPATRRTTACASTPPSCARR